MGDAVPAWPWAGQWTPRLRRPLATPERHTHAGGGGDATSSSDLSLRDGESIGCRKRVLHEDQMMFW